MVPGLGRTSISKYENGHPIPENVLDLIIEALNDSWLTLSVRGRITRSYLAEKADLSLLATIMKFAEEMKESFEAIEQTNIINKRNETDLSIEEKNKITYYLHQRN